MIRVFVFTFLLFPLLIAGFQNCARQSSFEGYSQRIVPVDEAALVGLNQFEGLRVLNPDVYMNCFEDHVQMGGVCNTGDASQNFIRYWITYNGASMTWGSPPVTELDMSRCENGRWTAIVPKPNLGNLGSGTGFLDMEVHFQIFLKAPNQSGFQAGSRAPAYTIHVQQNGACL